MEEEVKYNNTLVSGRADETLTYTKYVKDESSGKSTKELLDEKVNKTDQLGTTQIADKAVTTEKLAEHSVDNSKLSQDSVSYDKIQNDAVITEKIQNGAVTTEKVEEKAVTNQKLCDQSVDGRVVREASLESKHFANESVTTEKVARKSITKDKLADNSVDASQVVDGSIGNAKLSPDSVTTEKIKDSSVTNEKVADDTLGIEKFDPELRKTIQAATGLPEDLSQMIQDVDKSIKQLHEKDTDLQSNIQANQQQITANKSAQDVKNASLDKNMVKLNTRDDQITETLKNISATGGASVASAVTYDNTTSQLTSANIQGAVDELQVAKIDKTSILQESGEAEDKVMSQKAVSSSLNDLSSRTQLINGVSTKDINGENIETFVHSSGSLQKVNGFAGKKFTVQPNKRYYIYSTVKNNQNIRTFALYLNDKFIANGPLTTESSTCILDTHESNCNILYVSSTEDKLLEVCVREFTTNATTNEDDINTINKVAENKNVIDGYVQKELNFCDSYNDCIINTNGYKVSAEGFVVLKYDIRTASNLIIKNDINNEYCLLWSIFGNNILIQKGSNSKGNIIDYITPKGEYLLTCCRIENVNKVHVYNICPTSLIESDISFLVSNETQKGSFIEPTSGKVSKNADFLIKSYHIIQQHGTIKIPFSYEKASYLGYSFSNENDIIEYGNTNRNEFKIPTGATSFSMSYRGEERNTILQFYERNVSSITKLKDSNYRRKLEINLTDSEEEIADKLFFAFYLGNCDVFWEHGTYYFNNVFEYIHNKYNGANNNELPIGGNCRYYFNDSTIIGNKQTTNEYIMNNESLFGVLRQSTSFEINDATFVANGLIYIVHDDAGGNQRHYLHKYNNIKMQYISKDLTNDIRKCVGGGMGKDGHVIFNNCYFETDHQFAIKWHGNSTNSDASKIKIEIINSILKNAIGFETLPENNTGELELKFNYINDSGYINDSWKVLDIGNIKK